MQMDWLASEKAKNPGQAAVFDALSNLRNQKLYHELSERLLQVSTMPEFLQGDRLMQMYTNFVSKVEFSLDPLVFAQFAAAASRQIADAEAAEKYLKDVIDRVLVRQNGAIVLANGELVQRRLHAGKIVEARSLLHETKALLDAQGGIVDSLVHAAYYKAALEFYRHQGPAGDFFSNSLQYLTYAPLATIPLDQQIRLASDVGLAALLGTNVYNFGELVQHPIVKTLEGTEFAWLAELLTAFNVGDIVKYQRVAEAAKKEVMMKNASFLNQKIRIMALMEMVFNKPSDSRQISFQEIAQTCHIPVNEVELLLITAFSLGVVSGIIDEVEQVVRIKWVQPRVLDKEQLRGLKARMVQWSQQINQVAVELERAAPELTQRSS